MEVLQKWPQPYIGSPWSRRRVVHCLVQNRVRLFVTLWTAACQVHGISQAGILEQVAISFSRGSFDPEIEAAFHALQADSLPLNRLGERRAKNSHTVELT